MAHADNVFIIIIIKLLQCCPSLFEPKETGRWSKTTAPGSYKLCETNPAMAGFSGEL